MNVKLTFCLDDDVTLDYLVRQVGEACTATGLLCKGEQVSDATASNVYTSPGLPPAPWRKPCAVPDPVRTYVPEADRTYSERVDAELREEAEAERIRANMLDLDPYSP